jgi:hypothetical protein
MRLTAIALSTMLAAPAFAQEARVPQTPPPEGFYRNISGAYDLLFRPYTYSDVQLVKAPRLPQLQKGRATPESVIDWTKPVIGVDGVRSVTPEEKTLAVDVVEEPAKPGAAPLPPPCEPAPTANAPAVKPAGPSPCPATR